MVVGGGRIRWWESEGLDRYCLRYFIDCKLNEVELNIGPTDFN